MTERRGLVLILVVAALLRGMRGPARWDEIALAYAAYTEPVSRLVERGRWSELPAAWVGLHPPLHALLLAGLDRLDPAPALWIGASLLCSLGAVIAVGREGGPAAAAVLGSAPLQLAYAAEVNNYPLATLAVALVLAASRGPWMALAASVILAGWAHVLAGLAGLGVLVWRLAQPGQPGERPRLVAAVGLGLLPVGLGALRRMGMGSTWSQGGIDGSGWLDLGRALVERGGWAAIPLVGIGLVGLRGPALAAALPLSLGLGAALVAGAASPGQLPYLLLLGPPVAVAVGRVAGSPRLRLVALALCGGRALAGGVEEIGVLDRLIQDQARPRAVDLALARSRPGDALWLVAPALLPDDDKTDTSPVLWRLSPWEPWWLPPAGGEQADPRYGQPRIWRGMAVHTSTTLDPGALDAVAVERLRGGHRVLVVLYESTPAAGLQQDVERALRPYLLVKEEIGGDPELGPDWLYVLTGQR